MFFQQLYSHDGVIDSEGMRLCKRLLDHIDLETLDSTEVQELYPSFHECLGVSFCKQGKLRLEYGDRKVVEDVNNLLAYMRRLNPAAIRNKAIYNVSLSIMKPGAYIDWHYDSHTRSMLCDRLHIPLVTNPEVLFYGKGFASEQTYAYRLRPGNLYRLNNRTPHAVVNPSSVSRCHVLFDYLDVGLLNHLRVSQKLEQIRSFELSPVQPKHTAYNWSCVTTPPDGWECEMKTFNYSEDYVRIMRDYPITGERVSWEQPPSGYKDILNEFATRP